MKIALFLSLFPLVLLGQEEHDRSSRLELGVGAVIETKRFFVSPTVEWADGKVRPSAEAGIKLKRLEFFGGIAPVRTGMKFSLWRESVKLATVVERERVLGGVSFLIRHRGEFLILANTEVVKTTFLIHVGKKE